MLENIYNYDACVCVLNCLSCVCSHMDCSLPDSSVHEILQARILQWVAISFSRGSYRPRDQIHISCVSCITGGPGKSHMQLLYNCNFIDIILRLG